jgi:two-component system sensor kinase
VAPLITGALYQTRAIRLGLVESSKHNGDHDGLADPTALDEIADLLTRAMEELHGVIFALRPPDLDDLGVVAAIERYIYQVQRSGLKCRLELIGEPPSLMPEVRLAVYRIVQEALHNALRHAAADQAVVQLETDENLLRVIIRDNGAGFDPESAGRPTALGLLSMRERAAAIGATFAVSSRPGDGTTIVMERKMEGDHQLDESGTLSITIKPDVLDEAQVQVAPA